MPSLNNEHDAPGVSSRTTPAGSGPWSADKLAAAADETEAQLQRYADAGLLHQQPDGNGTATLFAALGVATGKVTDRCYERHGKSEFLDFLKRGRAYPPRRLHAVCDNYHTHKQVDINAWLAKISG